MKKLVLLVTSLFIIGAFAREPDLDTNIVIDVSASGDTTFVVKKTWLLAREAEQTTDPLYDKVKHSIRKLPNAEVEKIVPGRAENPSNVKRVERLFTEEMWNYLTPVRNPLYTYTGFLRAVGKFPAFCGDYNDGRDADSIALKLLATCLSHLAQETGADDDYMEKSEGVPRWRQSLYYVRERGYEKGFNEGKNGYNGECSVNSWQQEKWPCGTSANGDYLQYYGRGAKQLTYYFNYGPFSEAVYDGDATVLLNDPELVADTWLNLASAIFFFVYPRPPKPSILHVLDGTWQPNDVDLAQGLKHGFGVTINVINGGVECGHGETPQASNRVAYYKEIASYLGVEIPEDEELGCAEQGNFVEGGAGTLLIQWEDDWKYDKTRPYGNFACQLVGNQTAESALVPGDYIGCVERYYSSKNPKFAHRKLVIIDDVGPDYHDMSVKKLAFPDKIEAKKDSFTPAVVVANHSRQTDTAVAYYTIGSIYTDSLQYVLDAGVTDTIYFKSFSFPVAGTYNSSCSTYVASDKYLFNNTFSDKIVVLEPTITTITSISPKSAGNKGIVKLSLFGVGIPQNIRVLIQKSNDASKRIECSGVFVNETGNTVNTDIDLSGVPIGLWDVIVMANESGLDTLKEAFTILESTQATISEVKPIKATNSGSISIKAEGAGLSGLTILQLFNVNTTSSINNVGQITSSEDGNSVEATFNLENATEGLYSLRAINEKNDTILLYNCFTIENSASLSLYSIMPSIGTNSGTVSTRIEGALFDSTMLVTLIKAKVSESDTITDTCYGVCTEIDPLGNYCHIDFDLTDKKIGAYDLLVVTSDSSSAIMKNSFKIEGSSQPTLTSIYPKTFGAGVVSFDIWGENIKPGAEFFILKEGSNNLQNIFTSTKVTNSGADMAVTFNLGGQLKGEYSLKVKNPDGSSATFFDCITVEDTKKDCHVSIVGPNNIRAGKEGTYALRVTNLSNVENYSILLEVAGIPQNAEVKMLSKFYSPFNKKREWGELDVVTETIDTTGLPHFFSDSSGTGAPFLIPYIGINKTAEISFSIKVPARTDFQLKAKTTFLSIDPDIYTSFFDTTSFAAIRNDVAGCLETLFDATWDMAAGKVLEKIFDKVLPVECILSTKDFLWTWGGLIKDAYNQESDEVMVTNMTHWLGDGLTAAIKCTEDLTPAGKVFELLTEVWGAYKTLSDIHEECADDVQNALGWSKPIKIVQSMDPNIKYGPSGYGEQGFTTGDYSFYYEIHCENVDSATASAEDIVIIDTLDKNLNWSTLTFDSTKHTPTSIVFDSVAGVITWTFKGIYLEPNKNPPEGESWVSYHCSPDSGLLSGATITNRASIYFDANKPIVTDDVINTIDIIAPTSSMNSLKETQPLTSFEVSWSGSDNINGSGIGSYSIFVSENGEPFKLWKKTDLTSSKFDGKNNSTYSFCCVATDNVNLKEVKEFVSEASTTIKMPTGVKVNPNPFVPTRGHSIISFFGGGVPYSNINIYNKAYELVQELKEENGEIRLDWDTKSRDGSMIASGVYIYVAKEKSGNTSKGKFSIIR